jgi:hypothetical protein
MFKRIKNLLNISRYSVEDLINPPEEEIISTSNLKLKTFTPATIIDLQTKDPFAEYETTEQSSNDTTPRNG